ncbi:hypothetical protein [Corynebacterium callunae]|uniref:hypothetical protein n=1 Tax=Corynebacterium callunae TaxID=1721 RepID=UPI001FFF7DE2|nr:hypothetical protein [Corynebacterium callunae]MCK2201147.1 hypothetical protein [Corynebacterium callunae]
MNTVASDEPLTSTACGRNRVEAVSLSRLLVDGAFQRGQVSGTRSDEFFFENYL